MQQNDMTLEEYKALRRAGLSHAEALRKLPVTEQDHVYTHNWGAAIGPVTWINGRIASPEVRG